jgi:hypothetical protein
MASMRGFHPHFLLTEREAMPSDDERKTPDWDLEQMEVILESPRNWQLVVAGPGAGKSAVACQRIAYLLDEAVPPSRILLVSFSRAAVAELRDRIVAFAVAGEKARSVRISTIDSHAWGLRVGFEDEPLTTELADDSYEISIQRVIDLFRKRHPDLIDFMSRLEHLIIDEAQDVMGSRAELVVEMLKTVPVACGVTILADPEQAIYGFTTETTREVKRELSLLERLTADPPRKIHRRTLNNLHRVKDSALTDVFLKTRRELELAESPDGHVERVQDTIRKTCGNDVGVTSYESLADFLRGKDASTLVLFRRRADVLFASSYCSAAQVDHRIRMSDVPTIVRPWLGWLLGETTSTTIHRDEFDQLWSARNSLAQAPFAGEALEQCWGLLHRFAAGRASNTVDLVQLRLILARQRPPIEFCYPDLGSTGAILGTIHASKGREADHVILIMPPHQNRSAAEGETADTASIFEEARVYYVGATRARNILATAGNKSVGVGYLESRRVYRKVGDLQAQVEVGREGDLDRLAHLTWSHCSKAQLMLAMSVGMCRPLRAKAHPHEGYSVRLSIDEKGADGIIRSVEIGQLSRTLQDDLWGVCNLIAKGKSLKPSETIPHLFLFAVSTVGVSEQQRDGLQHPYAQSRLALAPVVKGFPLVTFLHRKKGGYNP